MANLTRRQWLKVGPAIDGIVISGLSYQDVAKRAIDGLLDGTSGKTTCNHIFASALTLEVNARPHWQQNPQQVISMAQCFGCWTQCGVRVHADTEQGKVLRIAGNPYHPLSHEHHTDASILFATVVEQLAGEPDPGVRPIACARDATLLEGLYGPPRVLEPMKRVGKRGEGEWQRISFEQLIKEMVEDDDLFGESHVDGLRTIHDPTTPLGTKRPGFGPKPNQPLVTNTGGGGRDTFLRRFASNNFGSKNLGTHGAYYSLVYRAGSGVLMGDLGKNTHVKPGWDNVEFVLLMGTSPVQSDNLSKCQARQLASVRLCNDFRYVAVVPTLPLTTVLTDDCGHRQSARPGSDSALVMGMVSWVIDKQRYNADYLAIPGVQAMQQVGEKSWVNAAHLVITGEIPTLVGRHLTLAHPSANAAQEPMAVNEAGEITVINSCPRAQLFVIREVTLADGQTVTIKNSFRCLRESIEKLSLTQYSQQCGMSEADIAALADAFTRHGCKTTVITYGGIVVGNGLYNVWSAMMFSALIGNLSFEGGVFVGGGKFNGATDGLRYDMDNFVGKTRPRGLSTVRSKTAYESSEEYRNKVTAGQSSFPAKAPRYPSIAGQPTKLLISALEGHPYPLKAWTSNMTNPFYGIAGLRGVAEEKLKDPVRLLLFIAIDAFTNETTALTDYIVPDIRNPENQGFSAPRVGVASKATTVC